MKHNDNHEFMLLERGMRNLHRLNNINNKLLRGSRPDSKSNSKASAKLAEVPVGK